MPTNNAVKPILVDACSTLTELEEYWKNIAETETADQTNHYATIDDLLAVCKRLRKEVKRHKKTKQKLAEFQEEFRIEREAHALAQAKIVELEEHEEEL